MMWCYQLAALIKVGKPRTEVEVAKADRNHFCQVNVSSGAFIVPL